MQHARDELKMISQARGASLSDLPGYAYDSRGGRGITVYLIDSGINANHEVRVTHYQESTRPSLVSRNSEICGEAYDGFIYQVNHGSKVITLVMGLVLPQKLQVQLLGWQSAPTLLW
jgi:subtilisin family serine protease